MRFAGVREESIPWIIVNWWHVHVSCRKNGCQVTIEMEEERQEFHAPIQAGHDRSAHIGNTALGEANIIDY